MEVHHLRHLTHKKNWSEYLLEFLMLFFAVTLGFFAENIRENISEQNKKKELLEVVAHDFNRDLDQLKFHENFAKEKLKLCNLLIRYLDGDYSDANRKQFYHALFIIKGWWYFNSEEKSRIEAESKGYFYAKENGDLASTILRFNFFKNDYEKSEEHEAKLIEKFNNQIPYISDFDLFLAHNHHPEPSINAIHRVPKITSSEIAKTKYIISEIIFYNDVYLNDIDSMKVYAKKAIKIIKSQKD